MGPVCSVVCVLSHLYVYDRVHSADESVCGYAVCGIGMFVHCNVCLGVV